MTAFVLAAGLGTRLRPLTDQIPKPLIPVGLKPLITFAFDHLIAEAGAERFVVNTHHLAAAYGDAFPDRHYRGRPIAFRHEPVRLETGGGLKNAADLLGNETFLVYNGDILTDLPLAPAIEHHRQTGHLVTLILRSSGPQHIALDPETQTVVDIHNLLETGRPAEYGFSGVYLLEPAFLERIPAGEVVSVIPIFLEMIRRGEPIGGVVANEGEWRDLGSRQEYLRVLRELRAEPVPVFPRYGAPDPGWRNWIHPSAVIGAGVRILGATTVGAGARVGEGATLQDCILWPGAEIASQSELTRCIVRGSQRAAGTYQDQDF